MKQWMCLVCWMVFFVGSSGWVDAQVSVRDMAGREVLIATPPKRVVCLAPGTLRLMIYLEARDLLVGVEDIEKRFPLARPYWIANSDLQSLPSVGPGGPGSINNDPDLEAVLSVDPDLIFITYMEKHKADQLQKKLGIPVVVLSYGPFGRFDETIFDALDLAGKILGKESRAREVRAFVQGCRGELQDRVKGAPPSEKPGVYIGGIGFKGTQGIGSTDALYAPFQWVQANNVVPYSEGRSHLFLGREALLKLDPHTIFIDGGGKPDVLGDIKKNRAFYGGLTAFRQGRVYILHSYNWYMTNIGTAMADAYAVGKIIYPDRFEGVSPGEKADEIYTFLLGKPIYDTLVKYNGPMGEKLKVDW